MYQTTGKSLDFISNNRTYFRYVIQPWQFSGNFANKYIYVKLIRQANKFKRWGEFLYIPGLKFLSLPMIICGTMNFKLSLCVGEGALNFLSDRDDRTATQNCVFRLEIFPQNYGVIQRRTKNRSNGVNLTNFVKFSRQNTNLDTFSIKKRENFKKCRQKGVIWWEIVKNWLRIIPKRIHWIKAKQKRGQCESELKKGVNVTKHPHHHFSEMPRPLECVVISNLFSIQLTAAIQLLVNLHCWTVVLYLVVVYGTWNAGAG